VRLDDGALDAPRDADMIQIAIAPTSKLDDYLESVRRADAEPITIEWDRHSPRDIVRDTAGILLTGGPDVEPSIYGEPPHATFEPSESGRDAHEIALIKYAIERDVPLFAICRGVQVLNVALGGTLIQDIPTQTRSIIRHTKVPDAAKAAIAHDVSIARESLLGTILKSRVSGADTCAVNSRHHQAVKKAAPDLIVSAVAADGIVEAVERPASRFCLGVQWHPENFWKTGEFQGLFRALVAAASKPRHRSRG
jgi:putative glutamine amidotransferase